MPNPAPNPTMYLNSTPQTARFWGCYNDLTSWCEHQLSIQNIGSAQAEMPTRVSEASGWEAGRQTRRKSVVIKLARCPAAAPRAHSRESSRSCQGLSSEGNMNKRNGKGHWGSYLCREDPVSEDILMDGWDGQASGEEEKKADSPRSDQSVD